MRLLASAFSPLENGTGLFFAHGGDLTLTQQRYTSLAADSKAAQKSQCTRADPRFFWNKHHTTLLAGVLIHPYLLCLCIPMLAGALIMVSTSTWFLYLTSVNLLLSGGAFTSFCGPSPQPGMQCCTLYCAS